MSVTVPTSSANKMTKQRTTSVVGFYFWRAMRLLLDGNTLQQVVEHEYTSMLPPVKSVGSVLSADGIFLDIINVTENDMCGAYQQFMEALYRGQELHWPERHELNSLFLQTAPTLRAVHDRPLTATELDEVMYVLENFCNQRRSIQ